MKYTKENLMEYCLDYVRVIFTKKSVSYYLTICGDTYKQLFHRVSGPCIAFRHNGELYYMFFNMSFFQQARRYVFTSVGIVSYESLDKKIATYEKKWHIETPDDAKQFLKDLEDVV